MKKKVLSLIIALCMIVTVMPLLGEDAHAATPPYSPYITSLTSSYNEVTIKWNKTGNPYNTNVEIYDLTHGKMWKRSERDGSAVLTGFRTGESVSFSIRAVSGDGYYHATVLSASKSVVIRSGAPAPAAKAISLNKMYYGTSLDWHPNNRDESYVFYTFRTSARKDSRYNFYIKATSGDADDYANLGIIREGTWDDLAGGDGENYGGSWSYYESGPVSLKPNTTYKLYVYGEYRLNFTGGIPYKFKVTEVIAKPAKGKITSLKSPKKKTVTVAYKKTANTTTYQIAVKRSNGNWKYYKTKATKKTFSKCVSKKTYSVKVRSIRTVNGKNYYGAWSPVRKIRCR